MADQPHTVVNVNLAHTPPAAEPAAAAPPPQPRGRKSMFFSWVLLVLGGGFGLHRIYLKRPVLGWLFLLWATAWGALQPPFGGSELMLLPVAFLLFDFFAIPGWVRRHNSTAATQPVPPAPLLRGVGSATGGAPQAAAEIAAPAPPVQPAPAERPEKPKDLKTLLLQEACRADGKLTVTQGVMATGKTFKQVEACLRKLVRTGSVDVDHEPDRAVTVYVFPELVGRPAPPDPESPPPMPEKPKDLKTLLLHEAHRGDDRLTVTQGVMATGKTFKRVDACLRSMVQARYVDVDNEPRSGAMVYVFPELVRRPAPPEPESPSPEVETPDEPQGGEG